MPIHLLPAPLIAAADIAKAMGSQFRGDQFGSNEVFKTLLGATLAIGMLWIFPKLLRLVMQPTGVHNPRKLFFELCRVHGLKSTDRKLLWKFTRECKIEPPAMVFVDAALLPASAEPSDEKSRIPAIRAFLFGAAKAGN